MNKISEPDHKTITVPTNAQKTTHTPIMNNARFPDTKPHHITETRNAYMQSDALFPAPSYVTPACKLRAFFSRAYFSHLSPSLWSPWKTGKLEERQRPPDKTADMENSRKTLTRLNAAREPPPHGTLNHRRLNLWLLRGRWVVVVLVSWLGWSRWGPRGWWSVQDAAELSEDNVPLKFREKLSRSVCVKSLWNWDKFFMRYVSCFEKDWWQICII